MSEGARELEVLFCVVKDYRQRDMILEGFLELGITGATIVDAHGMAQVLSKDVPIFAGLSSLFPRGSSDSSLILSVMDRSKRDEVISLIEDVMGSFVAHDQHITGRGGILRTDRLKARYQLE